MSEQQSAEFAARLRRAVERLEEKRDDPSLGLIERARLGGKVEGVKLALSYLDEQTRVIPPAEGRGGQA